MPLTLEYKIPENLEETSVLDKLKFLMYLHLSHKNMDSKDTSNIDLDKLLDYVYTINRILDTESSNKVRLIALEVLHQTIDVILKYFSTSFMTSLKVSERLMLISIIVKRNCFPLTCLPSRQPSLSLDHLRKIEDQTDVIDNRIKDLKNSQPVDSLKSKFVEASEVEESVLSKSISDSINRIKLRLLSGISWEDFSLLSLDEMQIVSLMMNDRDFSLVQTDDSIKLMKNEESKGMIVSESVILNPSSK